MACAPLLSSPPYLCLSFFPPPLPPYLSLFPPPPPFSLSLLSFRRQYEQLQAVIVRVLRPAATTSGSGQQTGGGAATPTEQGDAGLETDDMSAVREVRLAYENVKVVDCLDLTPEGNAAWEAALKRYSTCCEYMYMYVHMYVIHVHACDTVLVSIINRYWPYMYLTWYLLTCTSAIANGITIIILVHVH